MLNFVGAVINSRTSQYTKLSVLSCSAVPRTDRSATDIVLQIRIALSSGSALDPGINTVRKLVGSINGYAVPDVVLKTSSEAWGYSSVHNFTVYYTIPYSPGLVGCNLTVPAYDGTAVGRAVSFDIPAGAYCLDSAYAALPGNPSNLTLNTFTAWSGADYSPYTLAWNRPAGGTGGIQSYDVYYSRNNGGWLLLATGVPTESLVISPPSDLQDMGTMRYTVHARNLYGVTPSAESVVFTILLDSAIMWLRHDDIWASGKVHVKVNGIWKKAKKIWTKVSGTWKENVQ